MFSLVTSCTVLCSLMQFCTALCIFVHSCVVLYSLLQSFADLCSLVQSLGILCSLLKCFLLQSWIFCVLCCLTFLVKLLFAMVKPSLTLGSLSSFFTYQSCRLWSDINLSNYTQLTGKMAIPLEAPLPIDNIELKIQICQWFSTFLTNTYDCKVNFAHCSILLLLCTVKRIEEFWL